MLLKPYCKPYVQSKHCDTVTEEFDNRIREGQTPLNVRVSQSQAGWALALFALHCQCEAVSSYHRLVVYGEEVLTAPLPVDASLTSCVIPPVSFLLCGAGSIQKNWLVLLRTFAFLEFG